MCGRFVHHAVVHAQRALADLVGAELAEAHVLPPRYNLAPTQACLAFVHAQAEPVRRSALLRFGMARKPQGLVLNARAETVIERPMFRGLLKWHRCLVVATGFYEWRPAQGTTRPKTPFFFARADGAPFCFAALRARGVGESASARASATDARRPDGEATDGAAESAGTAATPGERRPAIVAEHGVVLLTCAANEVVGAVHGRMPVMLDPPEARLWLGWDTPVAHALELLRPYAGAMQAHAVSTRVNRPQVDDAQCLAPAG